MNPSDGPFPRATPNQQASFSHKHGLKGDWNLLESKGIVHSVYRVGDVVVKIPRDDPEWVCDTLTEAVALPPVHRAGVPTAPLIAFDDDLDVFKVPTLVIAYVDGRTIDPVFEDCPECGRLGAALAQLHANVSCVEDPKKWLDVSEPEWKPLYLERAFDQGQLNASEVRFLSSVLREASTVDRQGAPNVFLHNDVHENNLLFSDLGAFHLIDWGDAAWGEASHDFTRVPPEWLGRVLAEYESLVGRSIDLRRRIALNQIGNALRNIAFATVWKDEAKGRIQRLSVVCAELLDTDIAPITA